MTDPYRTSAEVPPEPPNEPQSVFESPAQAIYESVVPMEGRSRDIIEARGGIERMRTQLTDHAARARYKGVVRLNGRQLAELYDSFVLLLDALDAHLVAEFEALEKKDK